MGRWPWKPIATCCGVLKQPDKHESRYPRRRQSPSICWGHDAILFQLAGIRDANSNLLISKRLRAIPNVGSNRRASASETTARLRICERRCYVLSYM